MKGVLFSVLKAVEVFDCYCAVCLFIFAVKARSDSEPAASSQKSVLPPSLVTPQWPAEDILFQWRLRRKMEQAREGPRHVQHPSLHGPTFSWQSQTFHHPAANGPLFKVRLVLQTHYVVYSIPVLQNHSFFPYFISCIQHQQSTQTESSTHPHQRDSQSEPHASCFQAAGPSQGPAFVASGSLDSQPRPVASLPAHMHFLCDVLPCPIQPSHAGGKQKSTADISVSHVKTKVPENQLPDEPNCEPVPLSQPASSEAEEKRGTSHHKRPERKKKEKVQTKDSERVKATRKQKKSRY